MIPDRKPEESNKHLHVTCAIIEKDGLILAAKRSGLMNMPYKWEFPGGKIKKGETKEACLKREILEEMNLTVSIIKSLSPSTHQYPDIMVTLYPFICKIESGSLSLSEHSDVIWLTPDALPDLEWADADIPIVQSVVHLLSR